MREKEKGKSLVCKNWLTNKASVVMSKKKNFLKEGKKAKQRNVLAQRRSGGFGVQFCF